MINLDDWLDYQKSYDLVNYCVDENRRSKNETFLLHSHKYPASSARLIIQGFKEALSRNKFVDGDKEYVEELLFYISNPESYAKKA